MAQILVLGSTNEDIFYCGKCKLSFNVLSLYLSHKNECTKLCIPVEEPVQIATLNEANIPCNLDNKMKAGRDPEMNCNKITQNTKTLHRHGTVKVTERPYQCVICGRCFLQTWNLQKHILTHKVWPNGTSETTAKTVEADLLSYSCLYCDSTAHTYKQFRGHLKTHISLKKFKCIQNQCNSFYETIELLMNHVLSIHKTVNFRCHYCSKIFNSLEDIAVHYQSHDNKRPDSTSLNNLFKCTQCDAVFRKSEKLSLHMLTETHKKSCIHCNKMFPNDKRLRLHLQIHNKVKSFECNICGQGFHVKKYLLSHLQKHEERKHSCKICQSLFHRQDNLQRHMKSHEIRKKFKCPFKETTDCKKEFSRSDKLKLHIRSHTKKKE